MKNAKYYPKENLNLKTFAEGIQMWDVSLENTMFTYFCLKANKEFKTHAHESEQITMVLEGELYFKIKNDKIRVKKGEVIAVPSFVKHSVFTKNQCAVAVDAWSPVELALS